MGRDVELRCRCGKVHGWVRDASPESVSRVVCYCDDCQAFLHHLGRSDLLDAKGGSDIIQVAPATVTYDRGDEHIAGVRLIPKGMYRWYASCCQTPLGNTLSPGVPFIGINHGAFGAVSLDDVVGPPRTFMLGQFAIGEPPAGSTKPSLRFFARIFRLILGWKLRGKSWPHPFFERATKGPKHPLKTLSTAERDALRPLCGPRPAR